MTDDEEGERLVEVVAEADAWAAIDLSRLAEVAARATLAHLGLDPAAHEIALLACDDARIAVLNADFRGKPRPTNVLSWPSEERAADEEGEPPVPPEEEELGDIAIAFETCAAEAAAAGVPLEAHTTHLVVHAVLHLLGYDHETEADAALMEGTETEILASLGLPDPYSREAHEAPR